MAVIHVETRKLDPSPSKGVTVLSGVIVHEWLEHSGGAENVFEAMLETFPDAAAWSLWDDSHGRFRDVHETVLARTPLRYSKTLALPLMPAVWRGLPEISAEWMLVSSHLFAHHARFGGASRDIPKYVYAHTPARYIWTPELDRRGASLPVRLAARAFKPLDRKRAQEPVAIAANSRFVADRIANTWEREAVVIHPPVDTTVFAEQPELDDADRAALHALPDGFLLAISRWVPYKRLEAAITTGEATGRPVVIAGRGPDEARLRALAERSRARVQFVHFPSRPLLRAIYRKAAALVFPAIEDFGIVAVEAMASGTPVLANAYGGVAESVVDGVTGAHVHDWQSPTELRAALDLTLRSNARACRARAEDFSRELFGERIKAFVRHAHAPVSAVA
ncbi:glycosyltransferase [Microbacterium sp.]|uniref:glycosyltransferase n=1 Tax=Microbacterium sp. TaxID=51671 RepID=UPI002811D47A|nr:glycosyltransferase [Microbacterium sp.]